MDKRECRRIGGQAAIALLLIPFVSGASYGAAPANAVFGISKDDCVSGIVDKEKLASDLTNSFKLAQLRFKLMQKNAEVLARVPPGSWPALIDSEMFGSEFCGPPDHPNAFCGSDAVSLRSAKGRLRAMLGERRGPGLIATDRESAAYFRSGKLSDPMRCIIKPGASVASVAPSTAETGNSGLSTPTAAPTTPTQAPAPSSEPPPQQTATKTDSLWSVDHFRVRGYGRQIMDPHSSNTSNTNGVASSPFNSTALFDATTGLSINYKYNGQTATRTDSVVGAFGYEFNLTPYLSKDLARVIPELYLTPYIGMDRELTNKPSTKGPGTVSQFSTNFVDFGLSTTAFVPGPATTSNSPLAFAGQLISIRPDYLINYIDHSRIFSLNLRYVPLTEKYLNAYGETFIDKLQASLLFDIRTNIGWFTDRGKPVDQRLNRDYVRIGGRAGAALSYIIDQNYSLDLSADYVDFAALSGFKKRLGEYEATLALNFLPSKLFNISINYRNGRREDTGQRDEAWTAGLTLHY